MPVDWGSMLRVILPELALNVLLALVIYPVLRWLAAHVGASDGVVRGCAGLSFPPAAAC